MGVTGLSEHDAFASYARPVSTGLTGFEPEQDGRLASLGAATCRVRTPCPFARRVRSSQNGRGGTERNRRFREGRHGRECVSSECEKPRSGRGGIRTSVRQSSLRSLVP
ncbi:hypothetical protein C8039_02705 [Halogeometricum sp. wsp3]|nr:hypothetical protein C8039_02705 [Halogeometricum sp. wsp3]